jgi:hypothetical protein
MDRAAEAACGHGLAVARGNSERDILQSPESFKPPRVIFSIRDFRCPQAHRFGMFVESGTAQPFGNGAGSIVRQLNTKTSRRSLS